MKSILHEFVDLETQPLVRAKVVKLLSNGGIVVSLNRQPFGELVCDVVHAIGSPSLMLAEGDSVLVLLPSDRDTRGSVLGKVGPYKANQKNQVDILADDKITLRCGKGSITIEKSGRILLKGVEIVSRAEKGNRIRGASIKLN